MEVFQLITNYWYKFPILIGGSRTLLIPSPITSNPSCTIRFKICALHLMCKNLPFKIKDSSLNLGVKISIIASFVEQLSTTTRRFFQQYYTYSLYPVKHEPMCFVCEQITYANLLYNKRARMNTKLTKQHKQKATNNINNKQQTMNQNNNIQNIK